MRSLGPVMHCDGGSRWQVAGVQSQNSDIQSLCRYQVGDASSAVLDPASAEGRDLLGGCVSLLLERRSGI